MKFKSITILVTVATCLELLRYITQQFILPEIVDNWWEIDALVYINQGIYIFFLFSLATFFVFLTMNQKEN